ncbi:carboxymuconolactone decarboxylase family protein [Peterkaempfera griseoplana]|uniref:carboxymuconolactone decarboxylase family protein n=1 Tax=Peterkaempfera griseoplana TaxID=66896 RepID=UPI0006E29C32|nr:carboxymuconolactone decarboxylase family protein [Peterkaempfera griseoplana]
MSDVTQAATGRRIFVDKQSPRAYHALVQTSEAVRAVAADAGLDRALVELVNVRVSQINGCAYCLDVHTRTALHAGETVQRLGVVAGWRNTDLFSARERATLALAEATVRPADTAAQQAAYDDARLLLTDDEISAVVWVAVTINAFNQLSVVSRHPVRRIPEQ